MTDVHELFMNVHELFMNIHQVMNFISLGNPAIHSPVDDLNFENIPDINSYMNVIRSSIIHTPMTPNSRTLLLRIAFRTSLTLCGSASTT